MNEERQFSQEDTKPSEASEYVIRSRPFPDCPVCGSPGKVFQEGLTDVFFNAPGKWDSKKCLNPECRTVWLDPMPLEEDIHIAYRNYLISQQVTTSSRDHMPGYYRSMQSGYWAKRYGYGGPASLKERLAALLVYVHPGWKAALDLNVFFLKNRSSPRLLEIGCGAGRQLKFMQDLGWSVEGVDADPVVVSKARSKGLNVTQGYIYDRQYPDDSFDAVLLNHVIEHVFELDRFLGEIHRVLKPGGQLVVVTPNIESLGSKLFKHFIAAIMDTPRHLYILTEGSLRLLAKKAGFESCRIFTSVRHAGIMYMSDKAIDRVGVVQYDLVPGSVNRMEKMVAPWITLLEAVVKKARPYAGEELILIGKKSHAGSSG